MKTAIYIEDGIIQLVITPETKFEKNALTTFEDHEVEAQIFTGSFYDCRGGWTRQRDYYPNRPDGFDGSDKSIILRIKPQEENSDD